MKRSKKIHKAFDGFGIHLLQDEVGDFVAHFIELLKVSASAASTEEALVGFKEAWAAMKESYRQHKQPIPVAPSRKEYSGQFDVRIDKRDHHALVMEAAMAGISLNTS